MLGVTCDGCLGGAWEVPGRQMGHVMRGGAGWWVAECRVDDWVGERWVVGLGVMGRGWNGWVRSVNWWWCPGVSRIRVVVPGESLLDKYVAKWLYNSMVNVELVERSLVFVVVVVSLLGGGFVLCMAT